MATHQPRTSQRLQITKERWEVFNKKFRIEIRWDTIAAATSIKWHPKIKKSEGFIRSQIPDVFFVEGPKADDSWIPIECVNEVNLFSFWQPLLAV